MYTQFLLISRCFSIGSVSFYFHRLKIINVRNKNTQKREANVSSTYGGPLQCHNLRGEIGLRRGFLNDFHDYFDNKGMNIIYLYFVNILIYLRRNCKIFKFFFEKHGRFRLLPIKRHYLKSVLSYILEATDFIWN